ncbi:MAG: trypsin-like serine peptidase [Pseudochelatococcus sp.]|jgi:hypothetical protein|uniref:trypsin-like serine peptidase n=1 Tax=Pseudochelatococcus sp. TaxID=2020869 RepID=UPI003D900E97
MNLSGEQIDALIPVLLRTLRGRAELDQIVFATTGDRLFNYAGEGQPLRDSLFQLLAALAADGTEKPLLARIYRDRPNRRDVRAAIAAVYPDVVLEAPLPQAGLSVQRAGVREPQAATNAYAPGLERNVRPHLRQLDLHVWIRRLARIENRVCRMEIDGQAAGTGFLVGPQAVLTNWHVVEGLARSAGEGLAGLDCRFNHVRLETGARSESRVAKAAAAPLVDWSPYAPGEAEEDPNAPEATADELDYALIRLAEAAGEDVLNGEKRNFIRLPGVVRKLDADAPLLIVQHPGDAPMKLAMDTQAIIGFNARGTRLRYRTNTDAGSSGSPCFSMDWDLVALHHYGDPHWRTPNFNQGVPIGLIRERIVANGHGALIEA